MEEERKDRVKGDPKPLRAPGVLSTGRSHLASLLSGAWMANMPHEVDRNDARTGSILLQVCPQEQLAKGAVQEIQCKAGHRSLRGEGLGP